MVYELEVLYLLGFLGVGLPMAILANLMRGELSILPGVVGWLLFPTRAWREYRHSEHTSISFVFLEEPPALYVLAVALLWPLKLALNVVCWVVIAAVLCKDWVCGTGVSSGRSHPAGLEA